MQGCPRCGRAIEVAATTCVCGADLWHGRAADAFPRARNRDPAPPRDRVRSGLHPWCGPAAAGTFALGGITTALVEHFDRGSTGTGFGNLWILLLGLGVAATLVALGLILAIFRPTRDVGSILAAGGGAYAIGIVVGFVIIL